MKFIEEISTTTLDIASGKKADGQEKTSSDLYDFVAQIQQFAKISRQEELETEVSSVIKNLKAHLDSISLFSPVNGHMLKSFQDYEFFADEAYLYYTLLLSFPDRLAPYIYQTRVTDAFFMHQNFYEYVASKLMVLPTTLLNYHYLSSSVLFAKMLRIRRHFHMNAMLIRLPHQFFLKMIVEYSCISDSIDSQFVLSRLEAVEYTIYLLSLLEDVDKNSNGVKGKASLLFIRELSKYCQSYLNFSMALVCDGLWLPNRFTCGSRLITPLSIHSLFKLSSFSKETVLKFLNSLTLCWSSDQYALSSDTLQQLYHIILLSVAMGSAPKLSSADSPPSYFLSLVEGIEKRLHCQTNHVLRQFTMVFGEIFTVHLHSIPLRFFDGSDEDDVDETLIEDFNKEESALEGFQDDHLLSSNPHSTLEKEIAKRNIKWQEQKTKRDKKPSHLKEFLQNLIRNEDKNYNEDYSMLVATLHEIEINPRDDSQKSMAPVTLSMSSETEIVQPHVIHSRQIPLKSHEVYLKAALSMLRNEKEKEHHEKIIVSLERIIMQSSRLEVQEEAETTLQLLLYLDDSFLLEKYMTLILRAMVRVIIIAPHISLSYLSRIFHGESTIRQRCEILDVILLSVKLICAREKEGEMSFKIEELSEGTKKTNASFDTAHEVINSEEKSDALDNTHSTSDHENDEKNGQFNDRLGKVTRATSKINIDQRMVAGQKMNQTRKAAPSRPNPFYSVCHDYIRALMVDHQSQAYYAFFQDKNTLVLQKWLMALTILIDEAGFEGKLWMPVFWRDILMPLRGHVQMEVVRTVLLAYGMILDHPAFDLLKLTHKEYNIMQEDAIAALENHVSLQPICAMLIKKLKAVYEKFGVGKRILY